LINIVYIVSAYKLPAQFGRLLQRLNGPGVSFVVHVDRKTQRSAYEEMVARTVHFDVRFLPRHSCHWGGFGHVRATLKAFDYLVGEGVPFDYAVLLTGQDYPLLAPVRIERFFARADGCSFMAHWRLPDPRWGRPGGLERIDRWHVIAYRKWLHVSLPLQRRLPGGLEPFGGSPYWCFSRAAVEYVQRYVTEHPDVVRFFRHVFIPDEIMFQTILMNSPLSGSVVDDNVRHIDWTRKQAPAVFDRHDLPTLVASPALFARKFDETVDAAVLDGLDQHIAEQEALG